MITKFFTQPDTLESTSEFKQQILALGSALFFTENESLLKLPVHVINNVQMDDDNQIWFIIQRPTQALTEFDATLPAKLEFFKKGMPYHIKVTGTAFIVDSTTKVEALAGSNSKELVAICVKIRTIDYFETVTKPAQNRNWLQQSKQQLSSLFS
ncbi:hypothetical protein HB364_29510 [Pseudoflavitalea sp. X16]|uniref:hypothetical protein n=1 Tax=Paraflavitalea devenefica TaxID=2716334 RepID=UPI00141F4C2E|nr:hypothetical protein [Paraflavitalea devenefica]NII29253.1 hypothetical protein [Paraflavitalea devenefica]